jgi:hypothetical protein
MKTTLFRPTALKFSETTHKNMHLHRCPVGGYITTVNGATYAKTQAVTSEVNHHVDQAIWVKKMATEKIDAVEYRSNRSAGSPWTHNANFFRSENRSMEAT